MAPAPTRPTPNFLAWTAVAVMLTASAPPVAAQQAVVLTPVSSLPASTRAMALGNAYMMNARDADAIFYHPSLLNNASGFGLGIQRWGNAGSSASASAATQWFGGAVGMGLTTVQYSAPGGVPGASPETQDHLFADGGESVSQRAAMLGLARSVFGLDVGATGKLVEARAGGSRATRLLYDIGVSTDLGPLTAGLTFQDFGEEPLSSADGWDPARVVFGLGAYGRQVGIFDIGLTTAVSWSEAETVLAGGLELGYWPISGRTFVARMGMRRVPEESAASPMSFGFAFWGDDLVLEWAYRPFGDLDEGTHRFEMRWR